MTRRLCVLLTLALLLTAATVAQANTVTGLVVDENGVGIEGARVSVRTLEKCVAYTYTDAAGAYLMTDIAAGVYYVKAAKPHYGNYVAEGIEVVDGGVTEVPTIVLIPARIGVSKVPYLPTY